MASSPQLPIVSEPFKAELEGTAAKLAKKIAISLQLSTLLQQNLAKVLYYFLLDNKHWEDKRWLAYAIATMKVETGDFTPKKERRANPNRQPGLYAQQNRYWDSGYYGRGLCQVTWERNYEAIGDKIGVDLVANPDALLELSNSYLALRVGMVEGIYTGRKLSDYFSESKTDWINARRIINGKDRAADIAKDAQAIYAVLTAATESAPREFL
jgi:putative chitinase